MRDFFPSKTLQGLWLLWPTVVLKRWVLPCVLFTQDSWARAETREMLSDRILWSLVHLTGKKIFVVGGKEDTGKYNLRDGKVETIEATEGLRNKGFFKTTQYLCSSVFLHFNIETLTVQLWRCVHVSSQVKVRVNYYLGWILLRLTVEKLLLTCHLKESVLPISRTMRNGYWCGKNIY